MMRLINIFWIIGTLSISSSAIAAGIDGVAPAAIYKSKAEALIASGLDGYATPENQKIIESTSKKLEKLKANLGNSFGGSWIEYDGNKRARLVVGVTSSQIGAKAIENLSSDPDIEIVGVKNSYAALEAMRKKIFSHFENLARGSQSVIFSIALDDESNRLLVRGSSNNLPFIKKELLSAGFDLDAIKLEEQNGPMTFMGLVLGGTRIGSSSSAAPTTPTIRCTTGFNVIIDDIYPGSITAAHCYQYDTSWKYVYFDNGTGTGVIKGDLIGEYFASGWPDDMDAVIFGNTNFVHTQYGKIITTPGSVVSVRPLALAKPNTAVCYSGGTSGWRCGVQKSTNSEQPINGRTFRLSEANFCGAPGDSGGPVVNAENNALGIYTGVLGQNMTGTCGAIFGGAEKPNSVYQPLGPYLAKYGNVKLRID